MNFIMKCMKYAFWFAVCFFANHPSVKIAKEQRKHSCSICIYLVSMLHLALAPFFLRICQVFPYFSHLFFLISKISE